MTDIAIARILHVLAIVLRIGGVGVVTTVLLPALHRAYPSEQRYQMFHAIESRFAGQARILTLIAGASGFCPVLDNQV